MEARSTKYIILEEPMEYEMGSSGSMRFPSVGGPSTSTVKVGGGNDVGGIMEDSATEDIESENEVDPTYLHLQEAWKQDPLNTSNQEEEPMEYEMGSSGSMRFPSVEGPSTSTVKVGGGNDVGGIMEDSATEDIESENEVDPTYLHLQEAWKQDPLNTSNQEEEPMEYEMGSSGSMRFPSVGGPSTSTVKVGGGNDVGGIMEDSATEDIESENEVDPTYLHLQEAWKQDPLNTSNQEEEPMEYEMGSSGSMRFPSVEGPSTSTVKVGGGNDVGGIMEDSATEDIESENEVDPTYLHLQEAWKQDPLNTSNQEEEPMEYEMGSSGSMRFPSVEGPSTSTVKVGGGNDIGGIMEDSATEDIESENEVDPTYLHLQEA